MVDYDLLVMPGTALSPFPVEWEWPPEIAGRKLNNYMEMFYLTYALSLTGQPVISVPCGFTASGLPAGIQIAGRRRGDTAVLAAAAAYEELAPWADTVPPVIGARGPS
jgi:amidase